MPGGQFSHFRDKMSLAWDTVGQFRDDPGHSGTVGNPNMNKILLKITSMQTLKLHYLWMYIS